MSGGSFVVVTAGQSNMLGWFKPTFAGATTPLVPLSEGRVFNVAGTGATGVLGLGAASFVSYLRESMPNETVTLVSGAMGGTGLVAIPNSTRPVWSQTGSGSYFANITNTLVRNGLSADAVVWNQGENDAAARISAPAYAAAQSALFDEMTAQWSVGSITVAGLALNGSTADVIRAGQQISVAQTTNSAYVASDLTSELIDTVHLTGASYAWQAVDVARSILAQRGIADLGAPDVVALAAGGALSGTDRGERILGSAVSDVIDGGAGNDIIRGGAGDDTVLGGAGNDILSGGSGKDRLHGGDGNDHLFGDLGDDTFVASAGFDVIDGGAGNDVITFSGLAGSYVIGRISNDALRVTSTDGSIQLIALRSVERLQFDDASIDLVASFSAMPFIGGSTDDTLVGGTGADRLSGFSGNDKLQGGIGDDTIEGGAGNDFLDGGTGVDVLFGGAGDDRYQIDNVADVVSEIDQATGLDSGGIDIIMTSVSYTMSAFVEMLNMAGSAAINATGNDLGNRIAGNTAANTIDGAVGNDTITGNGGDDVIFGGAGLDNLSGGDGADTLSGGSANDVLTGGAGADVFLFTSLDGSRDMIGDFVQGSDKLCFSSTGFTGLTANGAIMLAVDGELASGVAGFVYSTRTRTLSYDSDGAGGAAAVEVAQFGKTLTLTTSDFLAII